MTAADPTHPDAVADESPDTRPEGSAGSRAEPASEEPTLAGSGPRRDEPPAEPFAASLITWLLLLLVLGVGLRLGHAELLADHVDEWEADGFVTAFEGRPWDADNRMRPPGHGLLLGRLAEALELRDIRPVRWLSVAFSVLALLAALELVAAASRVTGMQRRSLSRAFAFTVGVWAVHPSLIRAAVSPTPEALMGGALCLGLAGLCRYRARPGVLGWLAVALGGSVAIVVGGSVVAAAWVLGTLVYLLPVPSLLPALGALLALALGLGAGWCVQHGPLDGSSSRPFVPDSAWAHGLQALVDVPPPLAQDVPIDADVRERQAIERAIGGVIDSEPRELGLALAGRFADLLGPRRLAPLLEPAGQPLIGGLEPTDVRRALGIWDVFLRGGLLLFACAVLGMARIKEVRSSWPRAGIALGTVAWLLLTAAGAVGPLAFAPVDLVLLGAAGAGMASADPRRPWTRRLAFAVGGALLSTFLMTAGVDDGELSPWIDHMQHEQDGGEMLVGILAGQEVHTAVDHRRAGYLMVDARLPFVRRARAAVAHALEATKLDPHDDMAVQLLIRAQADAGMFREAAQLAEGAAAAAPVGSAARKTMELLLDWVLKQQRDARVR